MKPNSLIIASLSLVAFVFIVVSCLDARAEDEPSPIYYQYEADNGTLSFTDDPEMVPTRYYDAKQVAVVEWEDLKAKTEAKRSFSESHPVPMWTDPGEPEVNPNHLPDCSGHITISQIRVQEDEYNREYFVARDECGKVTSVTRSRPIILLNR